jgi:hypothetical protein
MPRPITALGLSIILFMCGVTYNSLVLENKIRRLNPDYTSKMSGTRRVLLIAGAAIWSFLLFSGFANGAWMACAFFSRALFIAALILSMFNMFQMTDRIGMEEMRVTHREIRFAKAIPVIQLAVSYVFSLVSVIVLISQPVNEVYYYTAAANAVGFMGLFVFTVLVNNYFSYRRPVQFNKKGGDDRAE